MRKDITVAAETRGTRGKNEARRLRVRGQIPAVLYGSGRDPVAVAVSPKEVNKILHSKTGHNTIFNLSVTGGEQEPVMVVDWQNDPIKGHLLHIDLKRIDLTMRIVVQIPIHVVGEPKGVKEQGGLLELITREVEIECLPDDIPDQFEVNVTGLMVHQNFRASELTLGGSMKLVSPADAVIAHVITLKAEAVAEGDEKAAEPEVAKKGKKEEPAADDKKKTDAKKPEAKKPEAKKK